MNHTWLKVLPVRISAIRLAVVLVVFGMSCGCASAAVSFIGTNIGGGGNGIAIADVNGDGKLDILEANGGLTVLLGNGNGTFQSPRQFIAGPNSSSIVLADLNRDGKLDVALSDSSSFSVYTLLGNGNGTFQAARQYPTGMGVNPISIVAADFNGDRSPTTVISGTGANGTITLSGPAPSTDATINLSSSNPSAASIPATVTVPAGLTQTSFSIYSGTVSSSQLVTFTATYGSNTQTATLTVNPASNVPYHR